MGEKTSISWATHTFNPVWGCTKVSPECDNCYAEVLDKRTGGDYWGPNNPPRITTEKTWKKPLTWNRKAKHSLEKPRVFCGSVCDVFDNRIPVSVRDELWELIKSTSNLDWLLLTKRATNIEKFLPKDWGNGYPNVWLGVSIGNRSHGLPRLDVLRRLPATKRFISAEPLLEDLGEIDLAGIDWVIVGGESGPKSRKMDPAWAESIRTQCETVSVPFFFKQMGGSTRDKGGDTLNGVRYQNIPDRRTSSHSRLIECVEA